MKICMVLGTRPEIIKLSSIMRVCDKQGIDYFIIHTNQHYDKNMDGIFFEELKLKKPEYNLGVGSCPPGVQIGSMIAKTKEVLITEKPDVVLVQGDTNSVLAGALAANQLGIKVGHVEAGLRSYDERMPEEHNRRIVDHVSNFLFAATDDAAGKLAEENVEKEKVFVVGNTVVDAVKQNVDLARESVNILEKLDLQKDGYIVTTAHRPENVDEVHRLKELIHGLNGIASEVRLPIIFSVHPRTKSRIEENKLVVNTNIKLIEPVGYLEFLQLMENAKLIVTDSGGMQEEASVLKVPCVTMRESTERPETVAIGCNKVVGINPKIMLSGTKEMLQVKRDWVSPYGDGFSAEKIIEVLLK